MRIPWMKEVFQLKLGTSQTTSNIALYCDEKFKFHEHKHLVYKAKKQKKLHLETLCLLLRPNIL